MEAKNEQKNTCSRSVERLPPAAHWYYGQNGGYVPFSAHDSACLEVAYTRGGSDPIRTLGGRYDVRINTRLRYPVFWEEPLSEVLRATWFFQSLDHEEQWSPFREEEAERLEECYGHYNYWSHLVDLGPSLGQVIINSPSDIVLSHVDHQYPDRRVRYLPVRRGAPPARNLPLEPDVVDHLVFVVSGTARVRGQSFQDGLNALDKVRQLSSRLLANSFPAEKASRVEYLPVLWDKEIHTEQLSSILSKISSPGISKMRDFLNDMLVDVLLYTSPCHYETILNAAALNINENYRIFCERNPNFNGTVSVLGHGLGSIILFDLLAHQKKAGIEEVPAAEESFEINSRYDLRKELSDNAVVPSSDLEWDSNISEFDQQISVTEKRPLQKICQVKKHIQGFVLESGGLVPPLGGSDIVKFPYPRLDFSPACFFSLGSPLALFFSFRGFREICMSFQLPTCPRFFNIFHPFDPLAFRIEPMLLIGRDIPPPVEVPHCKGDLHPAFQADIREGVHRVGHRIADSLRQTWHTFQDKLQNFALGRIDSPGNDEIVTVCPDKLPLPMGNLNQGKRIDFVLHKKVIEIINEQLFAYTNHVSYWDSADVFHLILSKIYEDAEPGKADVSRPKSPDIGLVAQPAQ